MEDSSGFQESTSKLGRDSSIDDLDLVTESNPEFRKASSASKEIPLQDVTTGNVFAQTIVGVRHFLYRSFSENKLLVKRLLWFIIIAAYNAYMGVAVAYAIRNRKPIAWCDGIGMLLILSGLTYWSLFYYLVLKRYFGGYIYENVIGPLKTFLRRLFSSKFVTGGVFLLIVLGVIAYVVADALREGEPKRLVSAGGMFILLFVIFIFSKNPGNVQWRQVIGGLVLQFVLALFVLKWDGGRSFLDCISKKVTIFLSFAGKGSSFIYDFVASGNLTVRKVQISNDSTRGPQDLNLPYPIYLTIPTNLAFSALSVIFLFSFIIGILYHIGVMMWMVRKLGWLLQVLVGTSAAESMNAAGNIFLGMVEAPLLIKPFLPQLTLSELHAVVTSGFATIAGTVVAAYISFGVKPETLLSASVMGAPCSLALSKLMYPETERTKTTYKDIANMDTKNNGNGNLLDAAAKAASDAISLVLNITANTIAFVSFIALLNALVGWFGSLVGLDYLSVEWLLGKLFVPFALCMGVDPSESSDVAELLGLKFVVNEFVAYRRLQDMTHLSVRSRRLAEYALCGFANLQSMGIQLGGLGAMAPTRRNDIASLMGRALITGSMANLINACVAGTLVSFK